MKYARELARHFARRALARGTSERNARKRKRARERRANIAEAEKRRIDDLRMFGMRCHGTYPFDDYAPGYRCRWEHVRYDRYSAVELDHDEAARLVNAPDVVRDKDYMWINKGFIVIGKPLPGAGAMQLACMELLGGSPRVNGIKPGDEAVYLHDGSYYLIRRVDPTIHA